MWSLKIDKILQCFIKFICKYSFTYFNFYSPPNLFFITLQQLISSSLIFQFWSNTVLVDFYFMIIYFGSKKQKYIKTSCHFFQWVFFLVYFDKFYPCFTSELHKFAWKSKVKKVLLFILLNLTNFINVLCRNYISKYEWKSNVKRVPLFILLNLTNFINILRQNYISMNEN